MTAVPDKRVPDSRGTVAGPSVVPTRWSRTRGYSAKRTFPDNSRFQT